MSKDFSLDVRQYGSFSLDKNAADDILIDLFILPIKKENSFSSHFHLSVF